MDTADAEVLRSALGDRYRLDRAIGRGGSAVVYLAFDHKHGRNVAIKVLHPALLARVSIERFLREINVAAGLTHPHICPLLDSGHTDGLLYYVMPHIEGESLQRQIERERPFPVGRAVQIVCEIAGALSYAHTRGIVHRDVKPGNVLLEDGHAILSDFGIARAIGDAGATALTSTGLILGTPLYMSPEQAAGEREIDGRSDIYSLGCVLYELLAGVPPYSGSTPGAVIGRKLSQPLPSLRRQRKSVPASLEQVVRKALARAPEDRFATAAEFAAALTVSVKESNASRLTLRRAAYVGGAVVLLSGFWIFRPSLRDATAPGAVSSAPRTSESLVRVGVLFPEHSDKRVNDSGDAALIQHLFTFELSRHRGLSVMDPFSLNSALQRAGRASPDSLVELRSEGVAFVLKCAVVSRAEGFDVTYLLSDTRTGDVAFRGTFAVNRTEDLPGQIRQATLRLTRSLEETGGLTKALDVEPWLAGAPTKLAATRAFLQGFEYSYRGVPGGGEYFREAVRIDPGFIAPRVWLVSGLAAAGDTTAAKEQVDVLRSLKSKASPFDQAMIGWADAVVRGDRIAKTEHLRVALSHSPRNNVLLFNLASTLVELGRYRDAAEVTRLAIESGWQFPPLFPLWGVVAIETGELKGLRETLEASMDVASPTPYLYGLLEALSVYDGDRVARDRYGTAFRQSLPERRRASAYREMVRVYQSLSEHARRNADYSRAITLLQAAADADPGSHIVRLQLARVFAQRGDRATATTYYVAVRDTLRDRLDALDLMSEVAALLGQSDEAKRHLNHYLELAPDGPDAVRVRERLRTVHVQAAR